LTVSSLRFLRPFSSTRSGCMNFGQKPNTALTTASPSPSARAIGAA
jgi:hypothetical protein